MIFDEDLTNRIRAEFPMCECDAKGRRRAFLDNGAGALVAERAAKAEAQARINYSANVGSIFEESRGAQAIIQEGRSAIADLLNAPTPETIVSGESATSLLFSLGYAIGRELSGRENIVTTEYEHYANLSPWIELEQRHVIEEVRFTRVNKEEGILDIEHLRDLVDKDTKVIAVAAASNVLGTKTPLREIAEIAREADAYLVVDAVHRIPHGPIDVQEIDCDFLVFSGYKFFSSHGSFLYGKEEPLNTLRPYKVSPASNRSPAKWEWGTRDQAKFAAICGVIDHLTWLSDQITNRYQDQFKNYDGRVRSLKVAMNAIERYCRELSRATLTGVEDTPGLLDMPDVRVYGPTDPSRLEERDPTFSFKVKGLADEEVVERLWTTHGIAVRTEDFYSMVPKVYGVPSMVRASFVHYNTLEEVRGLLGALSEIVKG